MFEKELQIYDGRYVCYCSCKSEKVAQEFCAKLLFPVRQMCFLAELYTKGKYLILDTPNEYDTLKIAQVLNENVFALE